MTTDPTRTSPGPRTLTATRRAKLAVVGAVALAVALVPASQALASGHGSGHGPQAGPNAAPVVSKDRADGEGSSRKGRAKKEPCGRIDEKSWWPFGNFLHGSTVAETKDGGIQPAFFQRGIVQTVSDTQVAVLSKDNYLGTWTLDDNTAVWRFGHRGAAADLAVGQCVGVWGSAGTADAPVAKFVVVKWAPKSGGAGGNAGPTATPTGTASPSATATPSSTPTTSSASPTTTATATGGSN